MKKHNPLKSLKSNLNKISLFLKKSALLASAPLLLAAPLPASASELDRINSQINTVSKAIEQKRSEQTTVENEVALIDARLSQINLEIAATEQELYNLTNEINYTNQKIYETEEALKIENRKMAEYLRVMYEQDQTSLVEILVKSNTFSEYVGQKEYLSSMQLKIKESADKIAAYKKELDINKRVFAEKKAKTVQLKESQVAQRNAQANQKALKDQMLANLRSQQAAFQNRLNDLHARKAMLSATFGEGVYRGSSRYPYGNPPPRHIIDRPDPWGYLIGECTSYVAWKRTSIGRPVPRGLGNANTWASRAAGMGLSVSRYPKVGDVMVMPYVGGYGHVAYVEAVYGNGTVLISEYNWTPYSFTTRTVNPWNYGAQFIH